MTHEGQGKALHSMKPTLSLAQQWSTKRLLGTPELWRCKKPLSCSMKPFAAQSPTWAWPSSVVQRGFLVCIWLQGYKRLLNCSTKPNSSMDQQCGAKQSCSYPTLVNIRSHPHHPSFHCPSSPPLSFCFHCWWGMPGLTLRETAASHMRSSSPGLARKLPCVIWKECG